MTDETLWLARAQPMYRYLARDSGVAQKIRYFKLEQTVSGYELINRDGYRATFEILEGEVVIKGLRNYIKYHKILFDNLP